MGTGVIIVSSSFFLFAHSRVAPLSIPDGEPLTDVRAEQMLYAKATLPAQPNLIASTPGSMRVSNSTYHPIRIALLRQVQTNPAIAHTMRPVETSQSTDIASEEINTPVGAIAPSQDLPQYGDPIHWDFVPREGHGAGLVLAIAEGHVTVQPGDVLTAFAQDGSRRYWGPYVVGMTEQPIWNSDTQEWSLVLDTPFPW